MGFLSGVVKGAAKGAVKGAVSGLVKGGLKGALSGALQGGLSGALSGISGAMSGLLGGKFSISQTFRDMKLEIVDAEGTVERAEVYFTNIETKEEVKLAMTPEKISVKTEANFRTFNIIERGEVSIPKGERLARISWSGILPGAGVLLYPKITYKFWEDPQELIKVFKRWREEGAKLQLLITQTPINLEVYLRSFDWDASGGLGDFRYSIDLIAAKELQVLTVEESNAKREEAKKKYEEELKRRESTKSKAGIKIDNVNKMWESAMMLTGQGGLGIVDGILKASGLGSIDKITKGLPKILKAPANALLNKAATKINNSLQRLVS